MSSIAYSLVLLGVAAIISRGLCIICYHCDLEVDPYCFNPAITECDGTSCARVIEIDETLGIYSTVYNCFKEDERCDNLQEKMNEETERTKKHLIDCMQCEKDICNDPIQEVKFIERDSEEEFLVANIDGNLDVKETASNTSASEEIKIPEKILEENRSAMDIFIWKHPEEGLKGSVAYEPEYKLFVSNSSTNPRPLDIFHWNNPNRSNID